MLTNEMIIGVKPFAVHEQMMFGLGISPGAARQAGDALPKGEVDALDEGGLDQPPQTDRLQLVEERGNSQFMPCSQKDARDARGRHISESRNR